MLVKTSKRDTLFFLSSLAALIALCVATYGLIDSSLYQPSVAEELMPGVASQDVITVAAALGILVCLVLIRRGREMGWLVWSGLLAYLFYAYALYSFDGVYNPLFLFYVAIVGLSSYSVAGFFARADLRKISLKSSDRPPPRFTTALLFVMLVGLFLVLWMNVLIPAMVDRIKPEGNAIFVQDLALFLPLLVTEAVLLFKKRQLGDALAIPLLVKVTTLGISVLLGTLLAPRFGQTYDIMSVSIYAVLGLGPLAFIFPFVSALRVPAGGASTRKR